MRLKTSMRLKTMEKLIQKDTERIFRKKEQAIRNVIIARLSFMLEDLIKKSDVYRDFKNRGPLWHRLGGGDLTKRFEAIIDHWLGSIHSETTHPTINGMPRTVMTFTAIKADYSDALSLPEAAFRSKTTRPGPRQGEEHDIEWLKWLLIEGRRYVVKNYIFTEKLDSAKSRGGGLMIPKKGGGWRVPREYAGTIDDNFLTRAIDEYLDDLIKRLGEIVAEIL